MDPRARPLVAGRSRFTRAGLKVVRTPTSLQQILAGNAADPSAAFTRFAYGPDRRRGR